MSEQTAQRIADNLDHIRVQLERIAGSLSDKFHGDVADILGGIEDSISKFVDAKIETE